MYKLTKFEAIQRLADKAFISPSAGNLDYVEYLKWVALGNTPAPADPDPPPSQSHVDGVAAKADVKVQQLLAMTPAQVDTFLGTVNTLPEVKALVKTLAKIVCVLGRQL